MQAGAYIGISSDWFEMATCFLTFHCNPTSFFKLFFIYTSCLFTSYTVAIFMGPQLEFVILFLQHCFRIAVARLHLETCFGLAINVTWKVCFGLDVRCTGKGCIGCINKACFGLAIGCTGKACFGIAVSCTEIKG